MSHTDWQLEEYRLAITTRNESELCVLAASHSHFVRARVAGNPATALRTRLILVQDEYPCVSGSAINPIVTDPRVIVAAISGEKWRQPTHWLLRANLMSHPGTPRDMVEELWRFGEMNLRLGRINRADCPEEILRECAQFEYTRRPLTSDGVVQEEIRLRACRRLGLPLYPEDVSD